MHVRVEFQDEAPLAEAFRDLTGDDALRRDRARVDLIERLKPEHRDAILGHWEQATSAPAALRSAWERILERRTDLTPWVHEAWIARRAPFARELFAALVAQGFAGRSGSLEDTAPLIACFPPALAMLEPETSLRSAVRDLRHLAGARVPIAIDPSAARAAARPLSARRLAGTLGLRELARLDRWLEAAARELDLEILLFPGAIWIAPSSPRPHPSPVDLAEALASAAVAEDAEARAAAFEALAALGVSGWFDWCEAYAAGGSADSALEAALFGAGPRGIERDPTPQTLELYLPSAAELEGDHEEALRLRFRSLLRRWLQRIPSPEIEARFSELAASRDARGDFARAALAWRDPAACAGVLEEELASGAASRVVRAWRLLQRAGVPRAIAPLFAAVKRAPADERLKRLLLEELEKSGLPLREEVLARWRSELAGEQLEDLQIEIDLRSERRERIDPALRRLIGRLCREPGASGAVDRLEESFARADPERRVHAGPRALLFSALQAFAPANAPERGAAAAFARDMGWILVGELLLRSEGVDPIPPPRLRDLDPYEGGSGG